VQRQVDAVTKARNDLQKQVDAVIRVRNELQIQVDEFSTSRDAALAEARNAQVRIEKLTTQLQRQVEEVGGLRDQVETIRSAVEDLLNKLKDLLAH